MLTRQYVLDFHSLNHDLFFESLSSTDAIQGTLADGFADLGSPYYGTLERDADGGGGRGTFSYTVRLPRFINRFNSRFNLYKLRGSVDHFAVRDRERETVKSKLGVGPHTLRKESRESGALKYEQGYVDDYPSCLSGTTFKTLQYDSTPYYESVFEHFKSNLKRSSVLIVIGYGFGDSIINKLIAEHLLRGPGSKIVIVDKREPELLPPDLKKSSQFIDGGVKDFDLTKLLQIVDLTMI